MDDEIIVSPEQAAQELLFRKAARKNLIDFARYTKHNYVADPFHHLVASKLDRVISGECKRLMIFAPPQHGKSELSTRRFPAFYLANNPEHHIISGSYNADFASNFGREVRDIVEGAPFQRLFPNVGVRSDNRSASEWQTTQEGKYYAVGVGSGTTGKPAHLFMIDDPIKDRKEADSAGHREGIWDWYKDVVYTRLQEGGSVVLTLTRWHYDDIAGRLLQLMDDGKGIPWEILTLPALPIPRKTADGQLILNDDGTVPGDPLGRRPNEPLAPNRFSYPTLLDKQEVMGDRSWSALYQQQPMSEDGGLFKTSWLEVVGSAPARRVRIRAWDLASTTDGDWTVGVLMSKDTEGIFYIENVIRFRGTPLEVERQIRATAVKDGKGVGIRLPQDPGQAGVAQAQRLVRMLAGYNVKSVRPTGSKEIRASGFAAQAEGRNVKLIAGHWNKIFLDELETFPLGTHDDQVDAASDAFNALLGPTRPRVLDW